MNEVITHEHDNYLGATTIKLMGPVMSKVLQSDEINNNYTDYLQLI